MKNILFVIVFFSLGLNGQTPLLVKDLSPGSHHTLFGNCFAFQHKLLFAADTSQDPIALRQASQLWITDGHPGGTTMLKDFAHWGVGAGLYGFVEMGSKCYFVAWDSLLGLEIFMTDGTPSGTVILKDIWLGVGNGITSPSSTFNGPVVLNGKLYFCADDSVHGPQLWTSDGTTAGTRMLIDLGTISAGASMTGEMVVCNGKLFFPAFDNSTGIEMWVSDTTISGTHIIEDIDGGADPSFIERIIVLNNKVFYTEHLHDVPGGDLHTIFTVTDGTVAGTLSLNDSLIGRVDYVSFGGKMYFSGESYTPPYYFNEGVWVTDGTRAGTYPIIDPIYTNCSSDFWQDKNIFLSTLGSQIFFSCSGTSPYQNQLWVSDGTPAGTKLLKNISNPLTYSNVYPKSVMTANGHLFFNSWDSITNRVNLWVSDGTNSGTNLIQNPSANSNIDNNLACEYQSLLTLVDSTLYFGMFYDVGIGEELYSIKTNVGFSDLYKLEEEVNIFPNPSAHKFRIKSQIQMLTNATFEFYDISGRLIQKQFVRERINDFENEFTFSSEQIYAGLYFVKIISDNQVLTKKLIIAYE